MDLPQTVHPSRLSSHFIGGYLFGLVGALVVAGIVTATRSYADALPFNPSYLYVVALLPLFKAMKTELRRRRYAYEFQSDRVLVRHGKRTVRQEDVPYKKITDISSVTPPFEGLVDVGDLDVNIAGADENVLLLGLRHPQRYEDIMLGRQQTGQQQVETIRSELQRVENQYNNGEMGRAEYERNYYYLKGKLDVLEEQQ